jgi:hypothetical protein
MGNTIVQRFQRTLSRTQRQIKILALVCVINIFSKTKLHETTNIALDSVQGGHYAFVTPFVPSLACMMIYDSVFLCDTWIKDSEFVDFYVVRFGITEKNTIILSVVLYVCEILSLTLRKI